MSADKSAEVILSVDNIVTQFNTAEGTVYAVNGVSFDLRAGELLGVVGESGCGKSVTMMSLVKLIPMPPAKIVKGSAVFDNKDLIQMDLEELQGIRGGQIGFIFQDPMTSLNPVLTVGYQLTEALRLHKGMSKRAARARAVEILELVGIPLAKKRLNDFPHQFSGGMRQRVMIAIALSCEPKVLIADEPTTALDVTIQAQILDLVKRLRQELGMAIIWVTHDLGVVASLADRVMVMYSGFIVERADVKQLYGNPKHPYTIALLQTLPELEGERAERLESIEGQPPDQLRAPTSCPFAPRCSYAFDRCSQENPLLQNVSSQHEVACWWDVQENRPRDYN
ncbi:MAG TPA: ABC transporter ATP-binding protein [Gammaproteobacteria bacterium]|jgi:peptide/nickel transport system ATP-binding protein/oligopeptide transport system ATP-binding protein|nr:ABC transporter ATP-binding protein [Gammaproteobacteria bacterium]PHS05486.1 MAG: peptide ABC transporter ATP-binding protein [Acidithiobacillus sp.]RTZ62173.1 MAG: peptide ABC transporter ATP-binding protein [Gammaproteobacteria bacterium]HBK77889.1 peptide ABC transporter ATP-binding protein [Gammaproteobacteria bacterium]HIM87534.1 ABC transporter ATP-binding protein [Gammaproteobacteria bacterium]|tara:strand:+ start:148 stop:1161 length:1014 start_codon:yes stop_codon:yes gene_type:complete